jgi:hypothetical protein
MEQYMNLKTLFAAAALLLAVAPAYAVTPIPVDLLPSAMLTSYRVGEAEGEDNKYDLWCYIDRIKAYRRKDCRDEHGFTDGWMSIDVLQHNGHEWSCSVKQIWRLAKGRAYRLDMRCAGEALFWDQRVVLTLSADKKTLYVKSEWRTKDREETSED